MVKPISPQCIENFKSRSRWTTKVPPSEALSISALIFYGWRESSLEGCEKKRRAHTGWGYQAAEKAALKDTRLIFAHIVNPVRAAF